MAPIATKLHLPLSITRWLAVRIDCLVALIVFMVSKTKTEQGIMLLQGDQWQP